MSNFFQDCKTLEEVKKLYRDLAKRFHPDKGGDLEQMKKLNTDYDFINAKILSSGCFTDEEREKEEELNEVYREKINVLSGFEGLNIELVGCWLWVTGNTFQAKGTLKENGFLWASKKFAWFFRTDENKCKSRSKLSLEEIRNKYGSTVIQGAKFKTLKK